MPDDVLTTVFAPVQSQWRALNRRDRVHFRLWARRSVDTFLRGEFVDTTDVMTDATADLQPKAIDWTSLLAFIQGLMPIIAQFMALSPAGG
jgi:hypothetical protein